MMLTESDRQLVRRIAGQIYRSHHHLDINDMIQDGIIGLLQAHDRYDPSQGASFETYASIRIRGAIRDGMRRLDPRPRSVGRNARKISLAEAQCEQRLGRPCSHREIAKEMGIDVSNLEEMRAREVQDVRSDLENGGLGTDIWLSRKELEKDDPLQILLREEEFALRRDAVKRLAKRPFFVYRLYAEEELTLREIGDIMNISESRVCQILAEVKQTIEVEVASNASLQKAIAC